MKAHERVSSEMKPHLMVSANLKTPSEFTLAETYRNKITTKRETNGAIIVDQKNKAKISSYYLRGQYLAIMKLQSMYPNAYVLFIGYDYGDMQPGVTGSFLKGDVSTDAALRELREETGFTTNPEYLEVVNTEYTTDEGYETIIYFLNANKCTQADVTIQDAEDNKKQKVAVMVYGSFDDMTNLIKKAKAINPNEGITFYSLVHVDHAVKIAYIMQQKKNTMYDNIKSRKQVKQKLGCNIFEYNTTN
jgi:23S rRNA U2552 (ribose-2'-O)-methylase RlmE/FtsJ